MHVISLTIYKKADELEQDVAKAGRKQIVQSIFPAEID